MALSRMRCPAADKCTKASYMLASGWHPSHHKLGHAIVMVSINMSVIISTSTVWPDSAGPASDAVSDTCGVVRTLGSGHPVPGRQPSRTPSPIKSIICGWLEHWSSRSTW